MCIEHKGFIITENNYPTLKTKESEYIFYSKNEDNSFSGYGKTKQDCIIKIDEYLQNIEPTNK